MQFQSKFVEIILCVLRKEIKSLKILYAVNTKDV